jgi:hypothetical protein
VGIGFDALRHVRLRCWFVTFLLGESGPGDKKRSENCGEQKILWDQ